MPGIQLDSTKNGHFCVFITEAIFLFVAST